MRAVRPFLTLRAFNLFQNNVNRTASNWVFMNKRLGYSNIQSNEVNRRLFSSKSDDGDSKNPPAAEEEPVSTIETVPNDLISQVSQVMQ